MRYSVFWVTMGLVKLPYSLYLEESYVKLTVKFYIVTQSLSVYAHRETIYTKNLQ